MMRSPLLLFGFVAMLAPTGSAAPVSTDDFTLEMSHTPAPDAALMKAAANGDTAKIVESLKAGADVNARNGQWNGEFVEMSAIMIGVWGGPPLAIAAGKGRLEATKLLLEKGADVDGRDSEGFTALIYAARSGNVEVVKLLLDNGADVNAQSSRGRTALDNAVRYRNYDVCQILVEKGADINHQVAGSYANTATGGSYVNSVLIEAINDGRFKIATLLIAKGADVNLTGYSNRTALMAAVGRGNVDLVKTLIDKGANVNAFDGNGATSLNSFNYDVTPQTRQQITQILQEAGATKNGWTPLMAASNAGDIEKVRLALDQKADINQKGGLGYSPLALAVAHPKVVSLLIERGADVNSKNVHGETSLIGAIDSGNLESARILLQNGADPNARNTFGDSALSRAIQQLDPITIQMLLDKGADVNYESPSADQTLLDYAVKLQNSEAIDLLKKAGAKTAAELKAETK